MQSVVIPRRSGRLGASYCQTRGQAEGERCRGQGSNSGPCTRPLSLAARCCTCSSIQFYSVFVLCRISDFIICFHHIFNKFENMWWGNSLNLTAKQVVSHPCSTGGATWVWRKLICNQIACVFNEYYWNALCWRICKDLQPSPFAGSLVSPPTLI